MSKNFVKDEDLLEIIEDETWVEGIDHLDGMSKKIREKISILHAKYPHAKGWQLEWEVYINPMREENDEEYAARMKKEEKDKKRNKRIQQKKVEKELKLLEELKKKYEKE